MHRLQLLGWLVSLAIIAGQDSSSSDAVEDVASADATTEDVASADTMEDVASADATTAFSLAVNPQFKNCLGPNPSARVVVTRGDLNDKLVITLRGIKPHLQFDLFTVENSFFNPNGRPDPNFHNFGLAWYQTDLEADANGRGEATIKTILLDQIFGFDAATQLAPTNTFHVGFWFNKPSDAAACGFNVNKPTPFNGEHRAGPMAMMSIPVRRNNVVVGPLCTKANGHCP